MRNRITNKDLETVCNRINQITGMPEAPYSKDDQGRLVANVGNYHIDGAYSGVKLMQMVNESGGVSDTLHCGYCTKRELYNQMQAFCSGLAAVKGE